MVNLPIYDTEHRCKCCGFRFERVLAKQTYCSDCAGVIHANRQMAQWWQEAKATLRKNHENDLPDEPDRPTPYRIGAFGTCRCSPREMLALRLLAYLTPYPMVAVITGISIARCVDFERGYDKTVKNSMDAIQFHLTQNRRLQLMELLRRLKRQLEKGDKVPPDVRIKLDAEYYKYLAELYDLGPEPPSEGTADQAELNRLEIPEDIAATAESLVDSFVRSQTNGPKL